MSDNIQIRKVRLTVKARYVDVGLLLHLSRHQVGGGMVRPEQSKLAAIQTLEPKTKKDVRTFRRLLVIIDASYQTLPPFQLRSVISPRKSAPMKVV